MTPDIEVSRDIASSSEVVFAAISDVTRMGEWSPETHNAEWNEGHDGPALGAMFAGHNELGEHAWTTEAKIVEFVPGERFAFDCMVGDFVFATWAYSVEATNGGCRVTESWQDHRPDEIKEMSLAISGVADRAEHNRAGIEKTLAQLAAAVE
ncbi:MAG: hypothetical protein ACI9C1_003438 [Candidatus Aldehydirespiratoraceae bacterium]|jgi:uncharacterized protein YndB with AHSA1/START domain